jgi:hypothetical protein
MTTLMTEPTTTTEPVTTPAAAAEPPNRPRTIVPRNLCERCRCPRATPQASEGGVADAADGVLPEDLTTLLPRLDRHAELDRTAAAYHAGQCDAIARAGYDHAAVNEARAFLEALVVAIGLEQERPREESIADFRKRKESHYGFQSCSNYLCEIGFFNPHERITVAHVYTIASDSGSHAGVSTAAWCRFVRQVVRSTAEYVLERLDAWQSGCRCGAE